MSPLGDLKIVTPISTFVLNTLETLRNDDGRFSRRHSRPKGTGTITSVCPLSSYVTHRWKLGRRSWFWREMQNNFSRRRGRIRDLDFFYLSVQLLILKPGSLTSGCFIRYAFFREVRDMLLFAHSKNLINDEEFFAVEWFEQVKTEFSSV